MVKFMTANEMKNRYGIPDEILEEYHKWELCDAVRMVIGDVLENDYHKYSDKDLERVGMIMALHDIGFEADEVRDYMKYELQKKDTTSTQVKMLQELRKRTLDDIHLKEKQLERIDYLKHKLSVNK